MAYITPATISSNVQAYQSAIKKKQKFWEGNFISDVFDTINVASYAVGGLISKDLTVGQAIKQKVAPSEALGVEGFWKSLAIDIITDPLTYTGFGILTKVGKANKAAGTLKSTFATQVKAGERALVSLDVPFIKGLQGIPLTSRTGIAKTLGEVFTTTPEYVKTLSSTMKPDVYGKFAKTFGTRQALGITDWNKKSLTELAEEIEKKVGDIKPISKGTAQAQGIKRYTIQHYENELAKINKELKDVASESGLTKQLPDIKKRITEKLYNSNVRIPVVFKSVYQQMKQLNNTIGMEYNVLASKLKLGKLEGKILPNVLDTEAELTSIGFTKRELGGKQKIEKFGSISGFKNDVTNTVIGGVAKKSGSAKLIDGQDLIRLEKDIYVPKKFLKELGLATNLTKALVSGKYSDDYIKKLTGKTKQEIEANLSKINLENLKTLRPEVIYKRIAISPVEGTNVMQQMLNPAAKFATDPMLLTKIRIGEVAGLKGKSLFIEELKEIGRKTKTLRSDEAYSKLDKLKGYAFPKQAIEHIDSTVEKFTQLREIGPIFKWFDKIQNTWKISATVLNFAFHTRNGLSNMWQLYLAGVDPTTYSRVAELQLKMALAFRKGDALLELRKDKKYGKFIEEFLTQGLGHTGFFTADMEGVIAKFTQAKYIKGITGFFGGLGMIVEDSAKLSLYIDRRIKGYSVYDAGLDVKKYLFDYSDLTNIEREVLKRVFPFYSWTRFNVPLQVSSLIQNPAKFAGLQKVKQAWEANAEGQPIDEKYLPEWLKEAYPMYLGTTKDGLSQYFKMQGFIPAVDLNVLANTLETSMNMLTPLVKLPIEMVSGYSFFYERQIQSYPEERDKFMGLDVSPKAAYAMKQIRPLNEISQLFGLSGEDEDLKSLSTRIMNFLFGKVYDYDLKKQKEIFDYVQSSMISTAKKEIKDAMKKGDTNRIKELQDYISKVRMGEVNF